ncbi:hypothetical protein B0T19DRAFT_295517 [Cercophora scortea]|uniref:Fungal N-terminal domain-containing protein n=1 Tax=Cercophora scortea TaxID=314031 RepID=A0AAE0I4X4_9PEZI|nr:hypothetical protein B0T19DRAFT_295517 [Cercophora scortea]
MDPVSVIGVAAASLQFAETIFKATLKSIEFVKDLHDIPEILRQQLGDTEKTVQRLSNIRAAIDASGSHLNTRLSESQAVVLRSVLEEGSSAASQLCDQLKPLVGQQQAQPGRRQRLETLWKKVGSVRMKDEVERSIQRIQRLNDEINREMQRTGLEFQAEMPAMFETGVSTVVSSIEMESHMTRAAFKTDLSHLQADVQSLRDELRNEFRNELRNNLRNDLLSLMTGKLPALPASAQAAIHRLSDADSVELTGQLFQDLVTHSSTLRESCDTILPRPGHDESNPDESPSHRLLSWESCRCRKKRLRQHHQHARYIGTHYEETVDHEPPCILAVSASRSWAYTLSVTLLPLISKTVEFTWGATSGGGGFSVMPPLRVYSTVERRASPIFQAFDAIRLRPGVDALPRIESFLPSEEYYDQIFGGLEDTVLSVRDIKLELVELLPKTLSDVVASGKGSLTDKDEFGNTLLHEIARLVFFLGPAFKDIPQLKLLIRMVQSAGVDLTARALGQDPANCYLKLEM